MRGRIMVIEERDAARGAVIGALERAGHEVVVATGLEDAVEQSAAARPDVLVAGRGAPDMDPQVLCRRITSRDPDLPVIVLTPGADLETAIAALRARASDCVTDPRDSASVIAAVGRALERAALREQLYQLRSQHHEQRPFDELIGASATMCRVRARLERIAHSEATVLIAGESGTGKEVVARALHRHGSRRGPFVPINCAAMPPQLIESELFGHSKGAFTDAVGSRPGLLAQANGGVVFLDEITALPLALQPKLLRALQERRVRPLGQSAEVPIDVRLIAATGRGLAEEVRAGRFRQDLYYRIKVLEVALPPLRERGYDVLLLAQHFIEKHASRAESRILGLTPGAAGALLSYDWPGNVRELENCIEAAVALARYDHVTENELPPNIRPLLGEVDMAVQSDQVLSPLDVVESEHIAHVLRAVSGNKARAARILELDRKTLYRKLKRYGLDQARDPAYRRARASGTE
jgi:two-component system response regulator HydG